MTQRFLASLLVAGFAFLAAASGAAAHTHVCIAEDGDAEVLEPGHHCDEHAKYELSVGWRFEPPVAGEANGLHLGITEVEAHGMMAAGPVFDTGNLSHDASGSWVANRAGTFAYHCHIHPTMMGTLTVTDGHGEGQTFNVTIQNFQFQPASLTVPMGAAVTWKNMDGVAHTATEGAHEAMGSDHGSEHADEHGSSSAVLNVTTLAARYELAGRSFSLDLRPVGGEPGVYTGDIIPTRAGTYSVRLTGSIHGTAVNVTVTPEVVGPRSDLEFPEPSPDFAALQTRVGALEQKVSALETSPSRNGVVDAQPGAATPGFEGLPAVAALAVAVLGAARRRA